MFSILMFCFVLPYGVLSNPQPSACRRDDSKCLATRAQAAYEAFFSAPDSQINSLFQGKIDAKLSTLEFTLTNTTTKGFKDCQIKDAKISSDKTSIAAEMFCPRFEMFGHYEADGIIEKLHLKGNGGFTLDARNYEVHLNVKLDTNIIDGRKYTKIADFDVEAELKGALDFKLENLFEGKNKDLDAAVHQFIKENPEFVTQFLHKPVFIANFKKLIEVFNKNLEHTPVDGFVE